MVQKLYSYWQLFMKSKVIWQLAKKSYSEANTEEAKSRLSVIKQKENLIKNL